MSFWNTVVSRLGGRQVVPPISNTATAVHKSGSQSRRTRGWTPPQVTALNATAGRAEIVKRSRAAVFNDSIARAIVDKVTTAVVGVGIVPRSTSPDRAFRDKVNALFLRWTDDASTAPGFADWYALQRALVYEWLIGGDAFLRRRERRPEDELPVPIQFSLHATEEVDGGSSAAGDPQRSREGVVVGKLGEVEGYNFIDPFTRTQKVVPAESVVHLADFAGLPPGTLRGLPILAPVLSHLRELDLLSDAVLLRHQLSNMTVAFLQGNDVLAETDDEGDLAMEPGTVNRLAPGESITWSTPPDPSGSSFQEFWRSHVSAIAAGVAGLTYEIVMGDARDAQDRTLRLAILAHRRHVAMLQHSVVAPALLRTWEMWFDAAIASKALALPSGDEKAHRGVTFNMPRNEALHPVQDQEAMRESVRSGLRSLSSFIVENGDDPAQVFEEIAADQQTLDRLGLKLDSDGRNPKSGAAPAPSPSKTEVK